MTELLMHESTKKAVKRFLANPSHALCLIGPPGAGKGFLANEIAHQVLGHDKSEAIHHVKADDKAIGIDQVRALQQFLRLKTTGTKTIRRVIIIEDAETMSDEAQNAILKTLEEPPADALFILTTDGSVQLRPTIYSRVQKLRVLAIPKDTCKLAYPTTSDTEFERAYNLSAGYAGLLYALLTDKNHELAESIETAKTIVRSPSFERLSQVDNLAKEKGRLPTLLYALQRVLGAALANTSDQTKLKRLVSGQRAVYEAQISLGKSANPKLLLTNLFLQI